MVKGNRIVNLLWFYWGKLPLFVLAEGTVLYLFVCMHM